MRRICCNIFIKIMSYICVLCFLISLASCTAKSETDLYLEQKIEEIGNIERTNRIDQSFIFITDLHWERNARHSPEYIKQLRRRTDISKVIFGGDYITQIYKSKDEASRALAECIDSFQIDDYMAILGNHDLNGGLNGEVENLTSTESFSVINHGDYSRSYIYETIPNSKFYYIYLDSNTLSTDSDQMQWLTELLLSLDRGDSVAIFMHSYFSGGSKNSPEVGQAGIIINDILQKYNDIILCNIVGIFSGHVHRDHLQQALTDVWAVSTANDCYELYDGTYEREYGTLTEQAFDVVQIDSMARKVFLTRVGCGENREYTY